MTISMNNTKKTLIVDGDPALRRTLGERLERQEQTVIVEAETGEQALERIGDQSFELIFLDVGLPDLDGRDLCRLLRKRRVKTPIIMLSDETSDADTILALNSGASDCVTKPLRLDVLLARVRAQHRLYEAAY
ncbi:MAG: response regulator [Pseudomonadota bacterium]